MGLRELDAIREYLLSGAIYFWIYGPFVTLLCEKTWGTFSVFLIESLIFLGLIWLGFRFRKAKIPAWAVSAICWILFGLLPYAAYI
jgi:hypothetical protein